MAVNKELAVTALLEAVYTTDRRACERFGITERTLRHYRWRLNSDPELSAIFHTKKAALDAADHERLCRLVKDRDDATLAELCRMVDLRELYACRLEIGFQLLPGGEGYDRRPGRQKPRGALWQGDESLAISADYRAFEGDAGRSIRWLSTLKRLLTERANERR